MNQVAFLCPDETMWSVDDEGTVDRAVPIKNCLDCSLTRHDRGCSWDFADLERRIEWDVTVSYTPSKMLGCDREQYLKRKHEYAVDPAKSHAKARGTATHATLETSNPGILSEQTIARTLMVDGEPRLVTVKPDKIYRRMGVIQDDKTWGYLPVIENSGGQAKPVEDKYLPVRQLSIGAWAAAAPEPIPVRGDKPAIPAIDPIKVTRGQAIFRDSKKQVRQDVELEPAETLEPWMAQRIRELDQMYAGIEPAPLPEDRRNFCPTCPVFEFCGIPMPKKSYPKKDKPEGVAPAKVRAGGVRKTSRVKVIR